MGASKRHKRVRSWLYKQNPFCTRCGVEMILPDDIPKTRTGNLKYDPENLCTIEHFYTRLESDRGDNKIPLHIICKKCNGAQSAIIESKLPKEALWEKSGRSPR